MKSFAAIFWLLVLELTAYGQTYQYDADGRLVTAAYVGGGTVGYACDNANNLTSITAPPLINSALVYAGVAGVALNYTITAANGPTSYAAMGLPSGLSVNPSTGAITGTTNATGSFSVTIKATNAQGTSSATLMLTINSTSGAPVITTQPGNQTVAAGAMATFTAEASGTPTPTYLWQISTDGGVTWSNITSGNFSGMSSSTLTVTNSTVAMSGDQFQVIATNSVSSATSNAATLTVNIVTTAPAITTQPAAQSVTAGNAATFTAAAGGTPAPGLQWQVSTNGGSSWSNLTDGNGVAGSTTVTLVISNTTAAMSGDLFRVIASNSVSSATSNAAALTVLSSGQTTVTAISAGNVFSLFLKSDGSLWGMGYNKNGQLGDGTTTERDTAESIVASGVTAMAAGSGFKTTDFNGFSLFLKSDGSLWAMGDNSWGELGDGTTTQRTAPEQIVANGVSAIAAAKGFSGFSLILKSDGSLWAMGDNSSGQLGDGTTTQRNTPVEIVTSGVTAIAAGGEQSLFLKDDGSLWAMGANTFGELGDGTTTQQTAPEQIIASGVTAISAGIFHSLFLKEDGSLWAMGDNSDGELGDGTTTQRNTPVQIAASGVTHIFAGYYDSLFIKSDGSLWAMGDNSDGRLGDGTTTQRHAPVQIVGGGVTAAAGGDFFSLFLKTDGSMWAMGDNSYGQFGNGATTSSSIPMQVYPNVVIPGAPSITTQPASLGITVGRSASFTVTATGAGLSYQWEFNGNLIRNAYAATYTISKVAASNAGTYTVIVSNGSGSMTSQGATLTVNTPPVITTSPTSLTVTAGQGATFKVAASGSPSPAFQWQISTNGGGSWTNLTTNSTITGTTAASLTVSNTTGLQTGEQFRAVATNSAGSATSKVATLTVNAPPSVGSLSSNLTSGNGTIQAGQSVMFSISATGNGLKYQWQLNGKNISGATKASYVIAKVATTNNGSYQVIVTNAQGSVTSSSFTLTVLTKPSITTQPKAQSAKAGATVTFSVVAAGTAPLNFAWSWNGGGLPSNISTAVTAGSVTTTATLILTNVTSGDNGSYLVTISNAQGSLPSASVKLTVK